MTHDVSGATPETVAVPPRTERVVVGMLEANCYLVICPATGEAILLDPGAEPERILERIRALGVTVKLLAHTHGHFDHISATEAVLAGLPSPVPVLGNRADAYLYEPAERARAAAFGYALAPEPLTPRWEIADGAVLRVGTLALEVIATPGHTPGSVCLRAGNTGIFTGDTLFSRGIGRTDLQGGDEDAIYASITERLYTLPGALIAYPGHGPQTTLDEERQFNPFVRG